MYPPSSQNLNYETDSEVYFFTPAFYPLDNYSAHTVTIWDITFPTAEHAYLWKKFSTLHPDIADQILRAPSPEAAKQISIDNRHHTNPTWHDERVQIMEDILRAKTAQHTDVQEILTKTGVRTIIENSPEDSFWGNGVDGQGENKLGKLWMKVRDDQEHN